MKSLLIILLIDGSVVSNDSSRLVLELWALPLHRRITLDNVEEFQSFTASREYLTDAAVCTLCQINNSKSLQRVSTYKKGDRTDLD